jgi:glycerol-3-phosphate dehydrogenase
VRVEVKLTAERLAAALDTISVTTTPAGVRPLAGGSSHRKEVSRDKPIIDFFQRICASTSMKAAMRGP